MGYQRLAIGRRHKGHELWPFLIHSSIQEVWNICFSSQTNVVTISRLLNSLQQIGHYFHKDSFEFALCYFDLAPNVVLSKVSKISGTGKGIDNTELKILSINPSSSTF